ncbi:MAG: stage III sporulation protein AD [Coprococcus sp.]
MALTALVPAVIIVIMMAIKLNKVNPEYSTLLSIGACLLIIFFVIDKLTGVFGYISKITSYINIDIMYIEIIMKMIGIAYICEFAANICKDAGYSAVASQIEMAGKVSMIALGIPVLMSVIDLVVSLLGGTI